MRCSIELDPVESSRILERAACEQAQIVIELAGERPQTFSGQLVCADEHVLLVEASSRLPTPSTVLIGRCVDVQILESQPRQFATHIVDVGRGHEIRRLALHRPERIHTVQRRRYVRIQTIGAAPMHLGGSEGETASAMLMNISAEGLACRMTTPAARLPVGATLQLTFSLPGAAARFVLPARVMNHTPADDGAVVLGMQFDVPPTDPAARTMLDTLREALHQRMIIEPALEAHA